MYKVKNEKANQITFFEMLEKGIHLNGNTKGFYPYTVNPLLTPPGAYFFQIHLRGSLIETGGGILAKTMVSVVH